MDQEVVNNEAAIKAALIKALKEVSLKISNDIVGCDDVDAVGFVFQMMEEANLEIYEEVIRSLD